MPRTPGTRGPALSFMHILTSAVFVLPLEATPIVLLLHLFGGESSSILHMTVRTRVTLTLRRNRQGLCSNCLDVYRFIFRRFSPAVATRWRLSRVSCSVGVEKPKSKQGTSKSLLASCSLASLFVPLFPSACQKPITSYQPIPSGAARLSFHRHLSCFADGFTDKHVKQPLFGFSMLFCLVMDGGAGSNLASTIRKTSARAMVIWFLWNCVMEEPTCTVL